MLYNPRTKRRTTELCRAFTLTETRGVTVILPVVPMLLSSHTELNGRVGRLLFAQEKPTRIAALNATRLACGASPFKAIAGLRSKTAKRMLLGSMGISTV